RHLPAVPESPVHRLRARRLSVNTGALEKLPAALFEIGKLIGSDLDPGILLSRIAELICQLIDAKACSVMLLDAKRVHSLSFKVGEGVAGWVVERGESALIGDVNADPRFVQLPLNQTPIASMVCVPLIARGQRVGCVTATAERAHAFDQSDL